MATWWGRPAPPNAAWPPALPYKYPSTPSPLSHQVTQVPSSKFQQRDS
jgi:hypothetical protein